MQEVIEGFRLSPQQARSWAVLRSLGGRGGRAWVRLRLRGELDRDALRRALDEVVGGHEVLRTRVVRDPRAGVPLQVIGEDAPAWAEDEDWSGMAPDEVEARLAARAAALLVSARDLETAPPVTAALVRTSTREHLLEIAASTLVADEETLRLVAAQLATEYAVEEGAGDPLQYADVSEWQNDLLESEGAQEGLRFWAGRSGSAEASLLPLPAESPTAGGGGAEPALAPLGLPPEAAAALADVAVRLGVPLRALVLGAWQVLLHRLTLRDDVTVSVLFDGRALDELRDALGPFARSLPVTCRIGAGMDLAAVARGVERACDEAARWQDFVPAGAAPDAARVPCGFAWSTGAAVFEGGGIEWSVTELFASAEPPRLSLLWTETGDGPKAALLYDGARFSGEAVERVAEELRTLLHDAARRPEATAEELEVVGPAERSHLLDELAGAPAGEAPEEESVEAWVDHWAERAPGRIALRCEDETLTYAELRARVNCLANRLHALGVGPETRVALLLDRSVGAVAAMLAVLRAGGAYVPLDRAYPRDRVALVVRDSGASLLLADAPWEGEPPADGCRLVRLDLDADAVAAESEDTPRSPASPSNLAYLVYTSGTTGTPKGVGIERRALARYVASACHALDLPEGAEYAVVSTFAADLGNTTLFPALRTGSTLHVVSAGRATDPAAWAEYADRHGIDVLKVVPSHLRLLLDAPDPARAVPRQRLVLGGEACDRELVERVRRLRPGCRVFNHYGPTESTVGVVAGEVRAEPEDAPPLGRPLPGARVYVLDARLRPVPVGVPGELHVGGVTLARGYAGRPEATAERFIPDPFAAAGGRMYRTGDRARFLPDGRIEFLGRLDDQVKISGYRVEPGEVAAVLSAHPAVSAARVIARAEEERTRLVAYAVPRGDASPAPAELRAFLQERLPEFMVPSAFVLLRRLPLTPNGKLDLSALPAAEDAASAAGERVVPRSELEARLVAVWEAVLGRTGVGVTDDFFDLGGNSFLAVRLMTRIQKELGHRLPLAALVGAGTVEAVARLLPAGGGVGEHRHAVVIRAGEPGPALFCVHPGEGTVLCYRDLARHLPAGVPMYGLQALDFELGRAPLVSIEEMATRYLDEIAGERRSGPPLLAGWSFGGLVAYEMARQLRDRGEEPAGLFLFDCRLPLTAPALARLDPALFRIGMLFHSSRLVADGEPVVRPGEMDGLDTAEQLELVSRRTGVPVADLLPPHVPVEQVERYLEIRMARTRGILEYGWPRYGGSLTLFRAGELDLDTPFPELRDAYLEAERTPDYGWGRLCDGQVEVETVPGTHHSMFAEPHVRALGHGLGLRLQGLAAHAGT